MKVKIYVRGWKDTLGDERYVTAANPVSKRLYTMRLLSPAQGRRFYIKCGCNPFFSFSAARKHFPRGYTPSFTPIAFAPHDTFFLREKEYGAKVREGALAVLDAFENLARAWGWLRKRKPKSKPVAKKKRK